MYDTICALSGVHFKFSTMARYQCQNYHVTSRSVLISKPIFGKTTENRAHHSHLVKSPYSAVVLASFEDKVYINYFNTQSHVINFFSMKLFMRFLIKRLRFSFSYDRYFKQIVTHQVLWNSSPIKFFMQKHLNRCTNNPKG